MLLSKFGIFEKAQVLEPLKPSFTFQLCYFLGLLFDWAASLWLFTFMHWRRKWQPTPVFLPGESQGWGWAAVYGFSQSQTRLKRLSSRPTIDNTENILQLFDFHIFPFVIIMPTSEGLIIFPQLTPTCRALCIILSMYWLLNQILILFSFTSFIVPLMFEPFFIIVSDMLKISASC